MGIGTYLLSAFSVDLVLTLRFLQRSSAHSLGFRNRSQRLLEYAERRQDIMSVSSLPSARVLGKRPAVRQESLDRPKSFSSIRDDEKHAMGRTLIFGQWNGSDSLGYVHLFVIFTFGR